MSNTTTNTIERINIGAGVTLLLDKSEVGSTHPEDLACVISRQLRFRVMGRDGTVARIRTIIAELARIDEERGGNEPGLCTVADGLGWISNLTTHTTEDYRRVLTAIADLVSDEDLPSALEIAEHALDAAQEVAS